MKNRFYSIFLPVLLFLTIGTTSLCDDITIIAINKETVEKLGPFPFTRDKYADIIEALYDSYRPKCVFLNLLIAQYKKDESKTDKLLVDAVRGKPNLFFSGMVSDIVAEHGSYENSQFDITDYRRIYDAGGAVFPLQEIVQNGAFMSISDLGINKDGIAEAMPTVVQIDGNNYLSTPLFLTAVYLGADPRDILIKNSLRYGKNKIKPDSSGWFRIDFEHTFEEYSYHDVVNGTAPQASINGRIILIGIINPGLEPYIPVGSVRAVAGVEVIANATQTLIDELRD